MKKRVISAIIALIIIIPLIILGGYAYYFGVGVLSIIGFYEIVSVYEKENKIHPFVKILIFISYLCIVLSSCNKSLDFNIDYRLYILNLFVCLLPLIFVKKKKYSVNDAVFMLAVTTLLSTAFNFLIIIRNMNVLYLIYVVLITIMSDTFAHFFGTKIGKIKLCPAVSPNKTVEGLIGGVFFGTFFGTVFYLTIINTYATVFNIILVSLVLSLISACGDLVFSAIKRNFGVKDYGNIMPGHGGVLDRLDSILFAVLAFSYLISFF